MTRAPAMRPYLGEIYRDDAGAVFYRPRSGKLEGCGVRIHDVTLHPLRRRAIESEVATHRVFLQPHGATWRYLFSRGELRTLTPDALERQISFAVYSPPDPQRADPR